MNEAARGNGSNVLKWTERAAWALGALLLVVWAAARISGSLGARREIRRFEAARETAREVREAPREVSREAPPLAPRLPEESPDLALWSPGRVKAWEETLRQESPPPLAVLKIPKIDLTVAVLEGTDDWTLNRAVGHIEATPRPGEAGNSGIAGHRDGFFRGLKDVVAGDELQLTTLTGEESYRISDIRIVGPDDVSVLDPTPEATLTLVTCYPFYFVGSAPQRYIVRAVRVDRSAAR